MRADTPVFFIQEGEEIYDEATGDYEKSEPVEHEVYANVTETGVERMNLLYGELKQGSKTIRLNHKFALEFDTIRIGDDEYQVDFIRNYRKKMTVEVSKI